jgi:hypothetical protein
MTNPTGRQVGTDGMQGVSVIPDDIAVAWTEAKVKHAEAVRELQKWEPKIRAYLGANTLGIRSDGRPVVTVDVQKIQPRFVEGKTRRDLRLPERPARWPG